MASKTVRIGVIGCGRIAREGHLPYLRENPAVELVAAMDVSEDSCGALCKQFGIPSGYRSPEDMLKKAVLDGVLICTPNWAHRDLTLQAAKQGIHVFCEKPMAVNVKECEEMVAACERAGVHLQMGMVKRFDAGILKVRRMIADGGLGNVSQMTTTCLNPPARTDTPIFQVVKRWAKMLGRDIEAEMGLWRLTDPRTGGGHLFEMGTHLLDLLLFFAGEDPIAWSGFINKKRSDMVFEDQGTLLMKFPSGVIAMAEMNMSVTADNLIGENGRVHGDEASLSFKHINGMWFGLPAPLYFYVPTQVWRYGAASPFTGIGVPVPVKVGKQVYMHKLQMDYFVDRILGRDTDYFGLGAGFAADGRAGLAVMRVIESAYTADGKDSDGFQKTRSMPRSRRKSEKLKNA